MAIPATIDSDSQAYRFQFIQPQTQSTTLSVIQSLGANSLNLGTPTSITPEYIITAKIIIRYSGGNWTLISVEKLTGIQSNLTSVQGAYLSTVTTTGLGLSGNGTPALPLYMTQLDGYMSYNDSATQTTPILYTAPNPLKITCDGLGQFTQKTFKPLNITELYNTTTNQFIFTDLAIGDQLLIRIDLSVDVLKDSTIDVYMIFDIGGTPFILYFETTKYFKDAGIVQIVVERSLYLGSSSVVANPAEVYFKSTSNATIRVNGFYISTTRRVL